ncbi:Type VI secretion lipoprotein/VasD [Pseudomonas syringae pv. helianthi]|uniref:Type VI secretion lipoprotein/VasD n=1 Tax=Pseudomonas syringae pv. helianthi TaxID=251654 RepID=A0A0P9RQK5_9PSED|nr:type VI secretion system lipoprotein TssJ [Pseudomonas syringae group genomosp. 7]KPX48451.1 Type VI secretion lipoprotein/VasD [Pseudomonas syringae pv. helianthi]RMV42914.1 Type VI secretion lipoprotein/VasD [Pseudomonas syringae pv. helianthi]UNB65867.1 type VI secretion system lipoprotein TssJ [Pseudomonas syringae pv. helianthi]
MTSMSICMSQVNRSLLLLLLLMLNGCSALSPYSTQTRLDIRLNADHQLNPDVNGRPSPIVLKVLELRRPVTFANMDFFSLYQRTDLVLGLDLVASEEFELLPGDSIELKLKLDHSSHYIGVLAAYRNLPETQWRQVIQVHPKQQNRAVLVLGESGFYQADTPHDSGNPT